MPRKDGTLRFATFYELEVRGREPGTEARTFANVLDQVEAADAQGYDSTWFVEHHFTRGFSHSSAPEITLAACSQRTKRIRLGHGVVLLPFFHPLRVASRIATLDIVSNGRVEFGTGRGASPVEYQVYGVPIENSREMWEECLDVVLAAWKDPDNFSYEGKYYKFPAVSIHPRPVQQPHPPVWCASVTPEGWDHVARKGLKLLGMSLIKTLDELTSDINYYFQKLAHYGHDPLETDVGMLTPVHVAETNEKARAEFEDPLIWYFKRQVHLVTHYTDDQRLQGKYQYFGQEAASLPQRKAYDALQESNMIIVGDPDHCIRKVEEFEKAGVNYILGQFQVGGLAHEKVMASQELFAKEVMSYFRARDAKRLAAAPAAVS